MVHLIFRLSISSFRLHPGVGLFSYLFARLSMNKAAVITAHTLHSEWDTGAITSESGSPTSLSLFHPSPLSLCSPSLYGLSRSISITRSLFCFCSQSPDSIEYQLLYQCHLLLGVYTFFFSSQNLCFISALWRSCDVSNHKMIHIVVPSTTTLVERSDGVTKFTVRFHSSIVSLSILLFSGIQYTHKWMASCDHTILSPPQILRNSEIKVSSCETRLKIATLHKYVDKTD